MDKLLLSLLGGSLPHYKRKSLITAISDSTVGGIGLESNHSLYGSPSYSISIRSDNLFLDHYSFLQRIHLSRFFSIEKTFCFVILEKVFSYFLI